jgi:NTE family protein/lysophospholipid hydrolase
MTRATEQHDRICEVLRRSVLFATLRDEVREDLAAHLELRTLDGGHVVFREGETADSMFILLSGRLRVSRRGVQGALNLYNEIVPGESVGETGMILGQPRAADVTAIRNSVLAVLHRSVFESLLIRHPVELNRLFSQAIYNHLRHATHAPERQIAQSFAVMPLLSEDDAIEVASGLASALGSRGKARLIAAAEGSADRGVGAIDATALPDRESLDLLERHFDYLVYSVGPGVSELSRQAFRDADQVIFVASAGIAPSRQAIERQFSADPSFALKRKHLVLLHRSDARVAESVVEWRQAMEFERIYPVRAGVESDYGRLSRFLTGDATGIVLGGGGARGFAHLGVIRALEEAGIPIDIIGGNSMGALIGAQYARGESIDRILDATQRFAQGGEWPTLPVISLLSGRRVARDLERMFGDTTIEMLWQPFFAAACNLSRAATTVQDRGLVWRAVLASNSPAGLLPPVIHDGDLLVDGAILDNVPVGAMRQRLGAPLEKRRGNGTVIAVDVDIQQDLGVGPGVSRLSVWKSVRRHLPGSVETQPGIGDILYRAGHIGGLQQRERTAKLADYYLEPPVSGFELMSYRSAREIADVGYRYAVEQIARWDRSTLHR